MGVYYLSKHVVRNMEDVGDWDELMSSFNEETSQRLASRSPRHRKALRSVGAMGEMESARRYYPGSQGAIITDEGDKVISGAVYTRGMHPRRNPYFQGFKQQFGDYELVALFRHPSDILAKEPSQGAGLEALTEAIQQILQDPSANRLVVVPGPGAEKFYLSHGFKRSGREYFLDMAPNAPVLTLDRRGMMSLLKHINKSEGSL